MAARQQDLKQCQEQVAVVVTMEEEEGTSIFSLHHHNAYLSLYERLSDCIHGFPLLLSYHIMLSSSLLTTFISSGPSLVMPPWRRKLCLTWEEEGVAGQVMQAVVLK